jgi:hypothetical protein
LKYECSSGALRELHWLAEKAAKERTRVVEMSSLQAIRKKFDEAKAEKEPTRRGVYGKRCKIY